MKGLEVVRHILGGVDEQIVEVMLITYEVWFCSPPAAVTALTFSNLSLLRKRSNIFFCSLNMKRRIIVEINKLLKFTVLKVTSVITSLIVRVFTHSMSYSMFLFMSAIEQNYCGLVS